MKLPKPTFFSAGGTQYGTRFTGWVAPRGRIVPQTVSCAAHITPLNCAAYAAFLADPARVDEIVQEPAASANENVRVVQGWHRSESDQNEHLTVDLPHDIRCHVNRMGQATCM